MKVGDLIRLTRRKRNLSQRRLSLLTGISNTEIKRIEDGTRKNPSPRVLKLLSEALGLSYDDLMKAAGYLPGFVPANEVQRTKAVPVLGFIRAGNPLYVAEQVQGWVQVPEEWIDGECFFLQVKGDSMINARIQEGDLVLVRRQSCADSGDIAVVMVDDEEATIKRVFYTNDSIILHPENPKYKPVVFSGAEKGRVKVLGKVLWVRLTPS